jgi:NAD(P)-dependent dehydrogenase (short-subunit alcohol dehydrogenase family)
VASVAESKQSEVAVVTGAAKGLGRAIAERLGSEGFEIVACDIDPAVDALEALGALTLPADVSKPEDVQRVVDAAMERHGRVDVLINNAGIARPSRAGDDWEKGLHDFEEIVGTNFLGAFLFGRAVAPIMVEQRAGHIVNISTDHIYPTPGHRVWGHGGMDLYNASKWALNGLTLDWATTLGRRGIRVNGICLGATDTPMMRSFAGDVDDEVVASWMRPEQIADLLLELLAEGPEGRTGHNLGCWVGRALSLDDSIEAGHRR